MAAMKRTRFLYRIVNKTFGSEIKTASLHDNRDANAHLVLDESNSKLTRIEGVIFDMDGTLTVPAYDFLKLRERLGLPCGVDILKAVDAMDTSESRAAAHKIIEEFEEEGLRGLQLQPHAVDLLRFVSQHSVGRALVTRNSQRSAQVFLTALQAGLMDGPSCMEKDGQDVPWPIFSEVLTRDFLPCKPDPAPLLHICRQWKVPSSSVVMVGDAVNDMQSGRSAGTVTVLLKNSSNDAAVELADFVVHSLHEVVDLFSSPFCIHR